MTPKQSDFIRSLASERVLPEGAQGDYVAKLVAGTAREPDTGQASRIIEWLLEQPRKAFTVTSEVSEGDVPAGRYALDTDGHVEFFVVDRPEDGRWAGRTFVSQQASDDKYPVRGARRGEVLARIAEDPHAAMIRYGHELGRCGRCGRTLTDDVSRAMGIGPDCADKLGIPRLSEQEARASAPAPARRDEAEREAEDAEITGDEHGAFDSWSALDEAPKKGDGRDKKGVPYGAGGWRARQDYLRQARADDKPRQQRVSDVEQLTVLPGETWEDIFGYKA